MGAHDRMSRVAVAVIALLASGCGDEECPAGTVRAGEGCAAIDGGPTADGGGADGGGGDAAAGEDGGPLPDGSMDDAGTPPDDDACVESTFYADGDMDGFGDPSATVTACVAPAGYVADDGDCDDACPSCHPGAAETCDGSDEDCDGTADEDAIDAETFYLDCDLDTYAPGRAGSITACRMPPTPSCGGAWTTREPSSAAVTDCNDAMATVNPAQSRFFSMPIPGGGFDYNCDGTEERQYTLGSLSTCDLSCSVSGWEGAVPACGARGDWFRCEYRMGRCVPALPSIATQSCR